MILTVLMRNSIWQNFAYQMILLGYCIKNTREYDLLPKSGQFCHWRYLYTYINKYNIIILVCPCWLTDVVPIFGRNPTVIFNCVLDFIYSQHSLRMSTWNQNFLLPDQLSTYANAVHFKEVPLSNCIGFIDDTIISNLKLANVM